MEYSTHVQPQRVVAMDPIAYHMQACMQYISTIRGFYLFCRCRAIPQPFGIHIAARDFAAQVSALHGPFVGLSRRTCWGSPVMADRSVVVQVFPVQSVSPPLQSAARQVIDIMKCGVRQGTKPAVERCGTRGKHEDEPVLTKTAGGFAGMVEKMEKRQQTTFRMHIDLP